MTDDDRRIFLKALDNSDHDVSQFEADFIASNLDRTFFSAKQRQVIDRMMEKYPDV